MKERLQKILSKAGFGSRRDCEKLILENRVTVDGLPARIGMQSDNDTNEIKVDGKNIEKKYSDEKVIIFYKPKNVLSEIKKMDDRKTVRELIPGSEYLFIAGRLDYDSEGLLLLTNNGEIANRLTHPRYEHEKEYVVLLKDTPTEEQLEKWENGVLLENRLTSPAKIKIIEKSKKVGTWVQVVMKEGRKREIREICRILGLRVKRLVRVRIATVELGNLIPGKLRELKNSEIKKLKGAINL